MNIQEKHIQNKKRVGTLHGEPVIEVLTKGGLWLLVTQKDGKLETCGTGPHRAVARYIAEKLNPDLVITELSKSDWIDEASILSVYDKYVALTNRINDISHRE